MKSLFYGTFYYLIFCLLLTNGPLYGQLKNNIQFNTIDNTSGLPGNTVNSIIKDELGFIWIGASDGLFRYEGENKVKIYRAGQPKIPGGLENSNIRSLFLDSKNNLWIGTRLGGLTKFHQGSGVWKTYRHDQGNPKSISNDEILTITEDKNGAIWIGTENGLNVFDAKTETFTSFLVDEKRKNSIAGKAILSILVDDQGMIWVGTWGGGINLLLPAADGDLSKTKFRQFFPNQRRGTENIWKIYQDRKQRYWIGSRGAGLLLMELPETFAENITSAKMQPTFHQFLYDQNEPIISDNHLEDIYQDVMGNLWLATVNGLNCVWAKDLSQAFINRKPGQKPALDFDRYYNHPHEIRSICNSNVKTIFEDNQGLIWFGTYSGISQYNWFANQFKFHDMVEDISRVPNTQNLYVDQQGVVWFGSGDGGIILYDTKNKTISNLKLRDNLLKNKSVYTLFSPDHKNLYIGTNEGIIILNLKTNESKFYGIPPHIKEQINLLSIKSLFCDKKKRIWMGTLQGLYVIDENTETHTLYRHNANIPNSISDNSINKIYQDSNGDTWIATFQGLNKVIDKTTGNLKFQTFKHDSQNPETSIPSNRVVSMTETNGILFIGSNTGISGYDLKQEVFENYNLDVRKRSIQSMEKTLDGNIWASTTEGILFYNPTKNEFNHYDKQDGLRNIPYMNGSSYRDHKGYLYFGGREGVTRFHPAELSSNVTPPSVFITDIRKMSPKKEVRINGMYKKEIVLEHNEYYLSLDFAALNYNRPEKNKYAFMLEGLEDKWNHTDGKTRAVYTNLKSGTYTFRVKAANNDGVWNDTGTMLKIIKRPAFWQTWWFTILAILIIGSMLFLTMKYYTKSIKERNKILRNFNKNLNQEIAQRKVVESALQEREQHMESLVKTRTKELEAKNQEVEKLLSEISQRNDHLELEISKRTKKLRASNKELQRSNKDLEQFAYIASHDLQEPLRVVGSFIGLLRRRYKAHFDEEAFQYIDFAVDGVHRMSQQIKNVLTFSKVSQHAVVFKKTDINQVIETNLHDLSKNIAEKNVHFKIEQMPVISCEKGQIEMIFYNLISNAIKFNKSESPLITISNLTTGENGYWHFSVRDNGIGIEKQYQKKIFEIFRRLNNRSEYDGTGIGLALCQKIVHRHQGKIWVESEEGKGTTFHFTISNKLKITDHSQKTDNRKPTNQQQRVD